MKEDFIFKGSIALFLSNSIHTESRLKELLGTERLIIPFASLVLFFQMLART